MMRPPNAVPNRGGRTLAVVPACAAMRIGKEHGQVRDSGGLGAKSAAIILTGR
jgi:hypothetical protein